MLLIYRVTELMLQAQSGRVFELEEQMHLQNQQINMFKAQVKTHKENRFLFSTRYLDSIRLATPLINRRSKATSGWFCQIDRRYDQKWIVTNKG